MTIPHHKLERMKFDREGMADIIVMSAHRSNKKTLLKLLDADMDNDGVCSALLVKMVREASKPGSAAKALARRERVQRYTDAIRSRVAGSRRKKTAKLKTRATKFAERAQELARERSALESMKREIAQSIRAADENKNQQRADERAKSGRCGARTSKGIPCQMWPHRNGARCHNHIGMQKMKEKNIRECGAKTSRGTACRSLVSGVSPRCYAHRGLQPKRSERCKKCKNRAREGNYGFCGVHRKQSKR